MLLVPTSVQHSLCTPKAAYGEHGESAPGLPSPAGERMWPVYRTIKKSPRATEQERHLDSFLILS